MIDVKKFCQCLERNGFDFFAGVPDSLLSSFCSCGAEIFGDRFIITANEGNAVAAVSGHYIAEGKAGVVFMQNSGIGNAVNPLLSLADEKVYNIPMLIITGWRGEPGVHDEPQHITQGELTCGIFDVLEIETIILDNDYESKIAYCSEMTKKGRIISLIIRKGSFSPYEAAKAVAGYEMTREQAIKAVIENTDESDIIVSTTGKASRELYELREQTGGDHSRDFLTVGSMGHTSSVALGISLSTKRNVFCIDGDGSFLMHMGACAVNASVCRENFKYIIINNGSHESVGGQPTVGHLIDAEKILKGCGFKNVFSASTPDETAAGIQRMKGCGSSAMVVYVRQGSRSDLGRPKLTPIENKRLLMANIRISETTALIFNSGTGSRMGELTGNKPKCLVKLPNGETILERQLRILTECGIRRIIITTGKYTDDIKNETKKFPGTAFEFVENPEYDSTNYIYSMYLAREYINSDILMLHGDLVFDREIVMRSFMAEKKDVCPVSYKLPLPEKDFKARVENGRLKEVSVKINDEDCFTFQPMYLLSRNTAKKWLEKTEEYIAEGKKNVYAEEALNEILDDISISVISYDGSYISEVDNEIDLCNCGYDIFCKDNGIYHNICQLPALIKKFNIRRIFAVVGRHFRNEFEAVVSEIENTEIFIYSEYRENPDETSVRAAAEKFSEFKGELLISVGGGSVIDTAKGIKAVLGSKVKHIAIPTTAGSGSEATPFSVYYKNGRKMTWDSDELLPDNIILDSSLADSLSFSGKMTSLLDALCHCGESLLSVNSTEESRKYAESGANIIKRYYRGFAEGKAPESKMIFLAAHLAGKAIAISRTGAGHAMSYVLTSDYGIKHGHGAAVCFKNILEFISEKNDLPKNIREIQETLIEIYDYAELKAGKSLRGAKASELAEIINIERMNNFKIELFYEDIIKIYNNIINELLRENEQ